MTEETKKQFFLIHEGGYSLSVDFGIIHMSDDELEEEIESNGDMTELVNRELGLGNSEFWTQVACRQDNVDQLFFLASAMANELKGETEIVSFLIDIYEKYKDMDADNKRTLLESVGSISKNLN